MYAQDIVAATAKRFGNLVRLASEFRLMGLKLLEWNERDQIELPDPELFSVVHSAFQRRFPYRYCCRDPILQKFCPLADLPSCLRHTADRATSAQRRLVDAETYRRPCRRALIERTVWMINTSSVNSTK